MLRQQRQRFILAKLKAEGIVRVSELADLLQVDPVTIRRDLSLLEEKGKLQRVHGGAVAREASDEDLERPSHVARRIAEVAAKLIPNNSVVFLGPGTLTAEIVPFLRVHTHLTVITNALNVGWTLARQRKHTLHILGGQVGTAYGIYGGDPEGLRNLRADRIILEAGGLDAERGLTHDDRDIADMTRVLLTLSAQRVVLVHPERVGRVSALFIAPASEIDVLITGREASNAPLWDLSELGVQVVLA